MKAIKVSVSFVIRTSKRKENGKVAIESQMSMNGQRIYFSIGREIDPKSWDRMKEKVRGASDQVKEINNHITTIRDRVIKAESDALNDGTPYSLDVLKKAALGLQDECTEWGLVEVSAEFVESLRQRKKNQLKENTIWGYEYTLKLISEYVSRKLRRKDIPLNEIKYQFIEGFYSFITERMSQNVANSHVTKLKLIINHQIKYERIDRNPFVAYKCTRTRTNTIFLTLDELELFKATEPVKKRMQRTKDLYLFGCFTGMAFTDIMNLTESEIVQINGIDWIKKERQKTKVGFSVPLLPEAKAILAKYSGSDRILPKEDNADVNKDLKELALMAGINKRITFHSSRHTFATTMLTKKVPIEVVSKMLGHSDISMTSHYAKVLDSRIEDAMKDLLME